MQDTACAAVDEENPSSPSEYETDEEWEEERRKKQAEQLKEQVFILVSCLCLLRLCIWSYLRLHRFVSHLFVLVSFFIFFSGSMC